MQKKHLILIGGACLVLAACVCLIFLLSARAPSTPVLTLSVRGRESAVSVRAAEQLLGTVQTGEQAQFPVPAGETVTLTATGRAPVWCIDGVRTFAESTVTFTMGGEDVHFSAHSYKNAAFDEYSVDTVVYEAKELGTDARRPFFPSVTQAADGTVLVVYYLSDGHALYNQSEGKLNGVLQLVRSHDNGHSWSEPVTLVDLSDEDVAAGDYNREPRDPNLHRLSDGTLLLTFPVRAPIGKAGLNSSSGKYNDYWAERAYYMTSTDNGVTWSEMRLIECDFFSTEPFLYDDPERTTGCWVKNGSIAETADGEILFPLYGYMDCSSRGNYYGVVVRAKNNGDGTLTFRKDWTTDEEGRPSDAAILLGRGQGNELGLVACGNTVYALARTPSDNSAQNAPVYRSLDGGVTWERFATEYTANRCLNQPYFTPLTDELVLVNYAVPLASASQSPARRTARPVYGKLFNAATGAWDEYDAVTVYDTQSATVADMGNPASVLLFDGRIFTVFYDTSAPAVRCGFIGGRYTVLEDYLRGSDPALRDATKALFWK